MSLTYVTAFIELPGASTSASANPADFLEKFLLVARTGVPIILYISPNIDVPMYVQFI
jgi:hypothetical protein